METIPDNIIILIEHYPFDSLSEADKQLVQQYLSREEYDSMFQTAALLHRNTGIFPEPAANQKGQLMDHFMQHNHRAPALWRTPVQLWKAASIILLLGGGWLLHWQTYQQKKVEYVTQLDTVYLEKEVPVKVYDTVYYKDEPSVTYTSNNRGDVPAENQKLNRRTKERAYPGVENQRRGVSAKDDSLIQSFKFVTL